MSPSAAKGATIKAQGSSEGSDVTIDVSDGRVAVTWITGCGRRSFTPEDLQTAIGYLETLADYGDGAEVWMEHRDSDGERFAACLRDGRFYAARHASDSAPSVVWSTFKRALVARAK